jgi:hypothetical protein
MRIDRPSLGIGLRSALATLYTVKSISLAIFHFWNRWETNDGSFGVKKHLKSKWEIASHQRYLVRSELYKDISGIWYYRCKCLVTGNMALPRISMRPFSPTKRPRLIGVKLHTQVTNKWSDFFCHELYVTKLGLGGFVSITHFLARLSI